MRGGVGAGEKKSRLPGWAASLTITRWLFIDALEG